jgi:hypothetical protein
VNLVSGHQNTVSFYHPSSIRVGVTSCYCSALDCLIISCLILSILSLCQTPLV